ncbi:MAG: FlgD immunoglobulin-like domain containing protein [Candidatus Latescibacterota bacterium]
MAFRRGLLLCLAFLGVWGADLAHGQVLRLRQQGTNSNRVSVGVGELVTIEVFADLQGVQSAGVSVFISVPSDVFQVVDQAPSADGVQPFRIGDLFFPGAAETANLLLPETAPGADALPGQQLEYGAVLAGGSNRIRTGPGVIATFTLICARPIDNGQITVDDNAVRETKLVLSDGISEQRFRTVQGMEITVTGIQLRDIPDVILAPGRTDSVTIAGLSAYVSVTSVPLDSLRWSFAGAGLDSLEIRIDPQTRRVTVTPLYGWIGRRQVTWTATEPTARVPGLPPLAASEVSTIIVNNPPRFLLQADSAGVKRDTVRLGEDEYVFQPGSEVSNPLRAYRWGDLDQVVTDPDIDDPQEDLAFAALTYGPFASSPVRGQVEQSTHQLLVWSAAEFGGVDSLKVLVRDGLRGGEDSLRVIVLVEAVNDAPRFVLADRNPKVTRGGSRTYLLSAIVADPDTPADSLVFSWVGDPGDHFTVDTTHTAGDVEITVTGAPDFAGSGRITFTIADPTDPTLPADSVLLFFEARESLPPDVFPPSTKIELSPGGPPVSESLDDFVNDPDNSPEQLAWLVPSAGHESEIAVDETRQLSVSAPDEFVGYEEVLLTVTDPQNQSDFLKLRVYSSDGDPVVGGIPDLVMDRGQTNGEIDLDEYYHDADNLDGEMFWEALRTFSTANLEVQVDNQSHLVTFSVPQTAAFVTETIVFRVTDPAGISAADTVLVTIRTGGGTGTPEFELKPFPTDLQATVGAFTDLLDLDDFVTPPDTTITWSVAILSGESSVPQVGEGNVLRVFGYQAGTDTLLLTARNPRAQVQTGTAVVRIVGESEVLALLAIPDVQFIAGQSFTDTLSPYVLDRVAHPDTAVIWSLQWVGEQGSIIGRINQTTRTLFATAADTGTAEAVLVARDTVLNVSGRDTIRIISLDPSLGNVALKPLPRIVFVSGQEDTSVVLDDFLPDSFTAEGAQALKLRWTVSGQRITQPVIGTQPPHRLRLRGVGGLVGVDTLLFMADVGGGFRAVGQMEVAVVEPVDDTTLELDVVPNPLNPLFIHVYVVARRTLAGSPNVIRSFDASDSTVAMRQIESDLAGRAVLVWSGTVRLRRGATGTVLFRAQAATVLGTDVRDTASVSLGTVPAGKPLIVGHLGASLEVPAGSLPEGTPVALQVAAPSWWDSLPALGELEGRGTITFLARGPQLRQPAVLRLAGDLPRADGVYRWRDGRWEWLGEAALPVLLPEAGRYAALRDTREPALRWLALPGPGSPALEAEAQDEGSGLAARWAEVLLDGTPAEHQVEGNRLRWVPLADLPAGAHVLEVRARDRAGNVAVRSWSFAADGRGLPRATRLGDAYPNPFNPETTIPFTLGTQQGSTRVQIGIYALTGQPVRQVLDRTLTPGQHRVTWDGTDEGGQPVASGVYLCRLETRQGVQVRRVTLLK